MGRLNLYPEKELKKDTVFITDHSGDGTATRKAEDVAVDFVDLISPVMRKNTYRGRNLGTAVTDAQKASIQGGTFKGLFIGDYWTINNVKYVIADTDYFLKCGDTSLDKHHLVLVPEGQLYTAQMNETNTTVGGYVGSKMYTEGLDKAKETITAAFGDMVLTHREYLTNAVTDGRPTGGAWFDSTVELMNEIMVYGCPIYSRVNGDDNGIPNRYTLATQQLALFRLNVNALKQKRQWFWLRDIVSGTSFAGVSSYGNASCCDASSTRGVRPYFLIG